jgi:hypothetical protein
MSEILNCVISAHFDYSSIHTLFKLHFYTGLMVIETELYVNKGTVLTGPVSILYDQK